MQSELLWQLHYELVTVDKLDQSFLDNLCFLDKQKLPFLDALRFERSQSDLFDSEADRFPDSFDVSQASIVEIVGVFVLRIVAAVVVEDSSQL
jgi:hypothetical protein